MSDRVQSLKELNLKQATRLYEKGEPITKIASEIGVSKPTISKWLREEGYLHKRKGRYPKAMPLRAKELHRRGMNLKKIVNLLRVPKDKIEEWIHPQKNPILGGEKDPLKLKGSPESKKRKKARPSGKRIISKAKWSKPIPPPHRCRKEWTDEENEYVFALIKDKQDIRDIYLHTRASKRRQKKIWKDLGGKGRPPNFPEPKPPPWETSKVIDDLNKKNEELEKQNKKLEKGLAECRRLIASQTEEIERLKSALEEATKQRKAIEAWAEKGGARRLPTTPPPSRRVLPGSYEQKELGLPEGRVIKEKRSKEKLPKARRSIEEWADNRQFFAVSNDWADLSSASEDELTLFADFLTREGFPAKVTPSGDQPQAFFKDRWPRSIERKWIRATERATDFLEAYQKRKAKLTKEKFSPQVAPEIAQYMAHAYDAYRNQELSESQKDQAKKRMMEAWKKAGVVDQAIMFFYMGIAESNGEPTRKGVERGLAAKRMLTEDAQRLAKRLGKKRRRLVEEEDRSEARRLLEQRKRELLEGSEEE